jgi:hypothetical protein
MDLSDIRGMSATKLKQLSAEIKGELVRRSGEGLLVEDRGGEWRCDTPAGGALLVVDWAVHERSYKKWYPSLEAAEAALISLIGDTPLQDGKLYADLTAPGCNTSAAWVEAR